MLSFIRFYLDIIYYCSYQMLCLFYGQKKICPGEVCDYRKLYKKKLRKRKIIKHFVIAIYVDASC